jgi:FixJ family two-component response regulator
MRELTKYEDAVMEALVAGKTPKEFAGETGREAAAVRMALHSVKKKLKARTLAEAVAIYEYQKKCEEEEAQNKKS